MAPTREETLESASPHPDFAKAAAENAQPPPPANITVPMLRTASNAGKAQYRSSHLAPPAGLREWEIEIPTRDGSAIPALVYEPTGEAVSERPILLFFHGGGWCIGNRFDDFQANRVIAVENDIIVVAANAHKIHKSASPSKGLIVGGTSAGGNIANAVVHLNREQSSISPVTGQFLSVPPLLPAHLVPKKYKDDFISNEQNKDTMFPPPKLLEIFAGAYNPDSNSPLFSPFSPSANYQGLPPTYIQACGVDVIRDDALIYERVLREEHHIATRVNLYSGLPHHFWEFFPQLTEAVEKRTKDTVAGISWLLVKGDM
ncbi:putative lipase 2 protein [Botrytis cinerea BcDW1]|uniref:Putative lipase 2 protein n=1 Tax=Botryotinia fuckeliana (strain BcDW1) TaxID=1290391 RepID=M7TXN4_BOTF1|nr:putative lipase 2 protein [Botrytis cinerea BcDW1]